MAANRWFHGTLNAEDQLFRRARPHCDELERLVGEAVKRHEPKRRIDVLELGCGTGFTSAAILRRRTNLRLMSVDNDPKMIAQARLNLRPWAKTLKLVRNDVLSHLARMPTSSVDAVATKFTLHNLERSYRDKVLPHIHRVLKPGGLFVNADKYALERLPQAAVLREQLIRYFDVFIPLGERVMFQETVAHYMDDENEAHVMRERQALRDMRRLGFRAIKRVFRRGMDAVYVATK